MKTLQKPLLILLTFLLVFSALAADGFSYRHNPALNPYAMQDIVADETAVYGFRPTDTGSLKMYADADWSDPEVVESGRQERLAYHESIASMYRLLDEMLAEGRSAEEIARAISAERNKIRLAAYENDPDGLADLKARNLEKYGHEEGPLPDELYKQYGSWEAVTQKAFSVNVGMDACLGLYDDYYNIYVALGQAEPAAEPAADGAPGTVVLCVVIALAGAALAIGLFILIFRRSKKE